MEKREMIAVDVEELIAVYKKVVSSQDLEIALLERADEEKEILLQIMRIDGDVPSKYRDAIDKLLTE